MQDIPIEFWQLLNSSICSLVTVYCILYPRNIGTLFVKNSENYSNCAFTLSALAAGSL